MNNPQTKPTPAEVLHRHLRPPAYDLYRESVVVDKENVSFVRERMTAAGHTDFRVSARL